jgi:hypothetical protein
MTALAFSPQLLEGPDSDGTLDDVIAGVCESLVVGRTAACPVCAGAMRPVGGALGCCCDCGTVLS